MKHQKYIKEFTAAWFSVVMGNGGFALVLNHFALDFPFLHSLGAFLWSLDIFLFLLFAILFILKFSFHPHHFMLMLRHPIQPLFLGCIPMALLTIVNGFLAFGVSFYGEELAVNMATALWGLSVFFALIVAWLVPFAMFLLQEHSQDSLTPVWLLPLVAGEVAATSGGLLLPHLAASLQYPVFFVSLSLWATSVFLALGVIALFFKRLVIHSLPEAALAPSIWLVLGPIGTAVLGLMTLGQGSLALARSPEASLHQMVSLLPGGALFIAILFWGFGFWWLVTALVSTIYHSFRGIPFGLSWWAFTFPLSVYTLGTLAIADASGALIFKFTGVACAILLLFFWVRVALQTCWGAMNQSLFSDPSIK